MSDNPEDLHKPGKYPAEHWPPKMSHKPGGMLVLHEPQAAYMLTIERAIHHQTPEWWAANGATVAAFLLGVQRAAVWMAGYCLAVDGGFVEGTMVDNRTGALQ